jgi:transcriptional regulator of acetoin/glycerol metabolism
MAKGEYIRVSELALATRPRVSVNFEAVTLDEMECMLIKNAISRFKGDISKAAKSLGISRSALYRRVEKHNIPTKENESRSFAAQN